MKLKHFTLSAACIGLVLVACEKDKLTPSKSPAMQLRTDDSAIEGFFNQNRQSRMQEFVVFAQEGAHVTTAQGMEIYVTAGSLSNPNGGPVQGPVRIQVIEAFDAGQMGVMNRTTEGIDIAATQANGGDLVVAPMVSGGEFFLKIVNQQGQAVVANAPVKVIIPAALTGGADMGMKQWVGAESPEQERDIVWEEEKAAVRVVDNGKGGPGYQLLQNKWGWTNVDRFYSYTGPKTEVICYLPTGFNNTNSEVYLSYVGEPNALASLDTYTTGGYFSEHYGQIPVGQQTNYIAIIEDAGQIKAAYHQNVTIVNNHVETFAMSEFTPKTQAQLENDIDALP